MLLLLLLQLLQYTTATTTTTTVLLLLLLLLQLSPYTTVRACAMYRTVYSIAHCVYTVHCWAVQRIARACML